MSSIDRISSSIYVPPSNVTQGTQAGQVSGADQDGDGDGGQQVKRHGRHGHGQMQNMLLQALQGLGLGSAASAATSSSSSTSNSQGGGTDSDGDTDGSGSSAAGNIKSDVRTLMHALFQAVKGESTASKTDTSANGSSTDPKNNFAAGLSALISQVSNGQAPTDLQNAFAQVVNDLQSTTNTTSSGSTGASGGAASQKVTLQALLTQMQQNLGYGASSSTTSLGNIVSTTA